MLDYSNHKDVLAALQKCQGAEEDMREQTKEQIQFLTVRDGQWEDSIRDLYDGKPRYSFDQTTPIIDQIAGDIEESDFDLEYSAADSAASEAIAEVRGGLARNIQNMSDAQTIYSMGARTMVMGGFSALYVTSGYVDDTSFDQDIQIKPIHNAVERVWFDSDSKKQDRSDSRYAFMLSTITKDAYKDLVPDGGAASVPDGSVSKIYWDKAETVRIGHFYYQEETDRVLLKLNSGETVFEDDQRWLDGKDELALLGVVEEDRRTVKDKRFWMRRFDNDDWIEEPQETPFSTCPIVPMYGNFDIIEDKPVYYGATLKLMDPQRVLNYTQSTLIGQTALAPREKTWLTPEQALGHESELATLNTNNDAYQFYNFEPGQAPPMQVGGAQPNLGIIQLSETMQGFMSRNSGIFAAGMGDNPGLQSGVAIKRLQEKSNNITTKYFKPVKISVCRIGQLINEALPIVYDAARVMHIIGPDGAKEMKQLSVIDDETGKVISLSAFSSGKYDVTCNVGPSYNSRKNEENEKILQYAQVYPDILSRGSDVYLRNMGEDELADRERQILFNAGAIPEDQMTDKELEKLQQLQQQPQTPDANTILAQAEMMKAQNDADKNQLALQKQQTDLQVEAARIQIAQQELSLKSREQDLKLAEKEAAMGLKASNQQFSQIMEAQKAQAQQNNDAVSNLNKEANTLKTLREAMGVDSIVGPSNTEAYIDQADRVQDAQE